MNIALWIVAGLLAAAFLASGAVKLVQSREKLVASGMGVVEDLDAGTLKVVGALEVLAAAGLILPAAFDIAPVLVPLAAVGVVLLMVGAVVMHLRRDEARVIAMPLILLVLGAVVAWGRFGPESFTG
ncbi:DoxX family protein [Streptomyces sp. B6B3]|uniref:DoxX family protein n=1 Tax=Streptomyces sp. B6B3 TaxID=3153570 RepID=UPI00325E2C1D